MRLTRAAIERNFLYNIRQSEARLQRIQDQAASEKTFTRPDEDPWAARRTIALYHDLAVNTQYLQNIDRAKTWLQHSELGLTAVTDALSRANELGRSSVTGTMSAGSRHAVAMELSEIAAEIDDIRAWKIEGRDLFQGAMPLWQIGAGVTVRPEDQAGLLQKVGQQLRDLVSCVEAGDDDGAMALLSDLGTTADEVLAQRSSNGARVQRMEVLEGRLGSLDVDLRRSISEVEEIDLTEVLLRLKSAEMSYEAALGAGARLIQPTLLDYLR